MEYASKGTIQRLKNRINSSGFGTMGPRILQTTYFEDRNMSRMSFGEFVLLYKNPGKSVEIPAEKYPVIVDTLIQTLTILPFL